MKPKKTVFESIRELGSYPLELDPPMRTVEDLDRAAKEVAKIQASERRRKASDANKERRHQAKVLAAWFLYPNGWITKPGPDGKDVPVAPIDALDRPKDIINALKMRKGTYVA